MTISSTAAAVDEPRVEMSSIVGWDSARSRRRTTCSAGCAAAAEVAPPAPPTGRTSNGPVGPGPRGRTGRVWHAAIGESPGDGVAIADGECHGWLVRWDRNATSSSRAAELREEYFEGDKLAAGGYGGYTAQAGWRFEKAARQVREMRATAGVKRAGARHRLRGYGFFRVAFAKRAMSKRDSRSRGSPGPSPGPHTGSKPMPERWIRIGQMEGALRRRHDVRSDRASAGRDDLMAQVLASLDPAGSSGSRPRTSLVPKQRSSDRSITPSSVSIWATSRPASLTARLGAPASSRRYRHRLAPARRIRGRRTDRGVGTRTTRSRYGRLVPATVLNITPEEVFID